MCGGSATFVSITLTTYWYLTWLIPVPMTLWAVHFFCMWCSAEMPENFVISRNCCDVLLLQRQSGCRGVSWRVLKRQVSWWNMARQSFVKTSFQLNSRRSLTREPSRALTTPARQHTVPCKSAAFSVSLVAVFVFTCHSSWDWDMALCKKCIDWLIILV